MTAAALPQPAEQAKPTDERDRAAVHAHRERVGRERERPPFRRVAIIASVPGLSRPHRA